MVQQKQIQIVYADVGLIPGLTQWIGYWHCCELWYNSQMQLRSCIAVAMPWASICSSDSTPRLGTSVYIKCIHKNQKERKKQTNNKILAEKQACTSMRETREPRNTATHQGSINLKQKKQTHVWFLRGKKEEIGWRRSLA